MQSKDAWFSSASEQMRISEWEMRVLLHEAYSRDTEKSFLTGLIRRLADPAMAVGAKNRFRPHPLWLTLGSIATLVFLAVAFFSVVRG